MLTSSDINTDAFEQCQVLTDPCGATHDDPISLFLPLLCKIVDDICRLDGSHVIKSIICSLLSTLSGPLADEIITAYAPSLLHAIIGSLCLYYNFSVNSPFLLPDLPHLRNSSQFDDGHALMLALLHFNKPSTPLEEHPSVFRTCDLDDYTTITAEDVGLSYERPISPEDDIQRSSPVFSFPPDSHIIPNRDNETGVHVPVFVVAERTNIKALMIASLYQRFVLSIDEPLVGLELSDTSPIVHVHVGWLELVEDVVCFDFHPSITF